MNCERYAMKLPQIDMDKFEERFEDDSEFEMEEGTYLVYEHGIWELYDWDEGFYFHNMDIRKYANVYEPEAIFGPLPMKAEV